MKGGVRWKEGADTCVFKPSVACKDDAAYPGNLEGMVSRIITKGSRDIEIERVLNQEYEYLIRLGFVSAFSKRCTPQFSSSNLNFTTMTLQPKTGGPCLSIATRKEENLENLITGEYDISLRDYALARIERSGTIPISTLIGYLRGAICAAIELVPDNGIWVIHMDLHLGNILIRFGKQGQSSYTALSDWGRAMAFESNNPLSIFFALHWYLQWAKGIHYKDYAEKNRNKVTFQKLGKNFERVGAFQSSTTMFTAIDTLFRNLENMTGLSLKPERFRMMPDGSIYKDYNNEILNPASVDALKTLRGFMVYVMIKQVFLGLHRPLPSWLSSLLYTKNQAELISIINKNIPTPGGFYNKAFVTPPPLSTATIAANTTLPTTATQEVEDPKVKTYMNDLKNKPDEVESILLMKDEDLASLGYNKTPNSKDFYIRIAARKLKEAKQGGRRKQSRKLKRKSKKTRKI